MLSPTYGIYSGYELCENVPLRPGSEEYMDSEKYQYRPRDWEAAARDGVGIADYITELNRIRRAHPALHRLRNLRFHTLTSRNLCASPSAWMVSPDAPGAIPYWWSSTSTRTRPGGHGLARHARPWRGPRVHRDG